MMSFFFRPVRKVWAPVHLLPAAPAAAVPNIMRRTRDSFCSSLDQCSVREAGSKAININMGINVTALDGVEYAFPSLPAAAEGRTVYISRHGESMYNLDNRIGGNPNLSPRGRQYARALGSHINSLNIPNLRVMRSKSNSSHMSRAFLRIKTRATLEPAFSSFAYRCTHASAQGRSLRN